MNASHVETTSRTSGRTYSNNQTNDQSDRAGIESKCRPLEAIAESGTYHTTRSGQSILEH